MKRLIQTFQNIFKITELRERIVYTLLLLAVYRFGSYIILPGINTAELQALFNQKQGGGILDFFNTFVGGAFARGSIFALGIMPYISASIIIQLLGAALPQFQRLQKEGESGQRKLNQYTRYLAVAITVAQSSGYLVNLQSQYGSAIPAGNTWFWITSVFCLTAGTMFLVYLGERITENGIGNGISLIIAIGIVAELPGALISEFQANSLMLFYIELIALSVVTMAVILLTTGTRKIPVNYARAMMGNRMIGMTQQVQPRQYIPLKINAAGVMPIIFAQSIMFIPATVATFFQDSDFWLGAGNFLSNYQSFGYNAIFVTLIILFTYFYTAIVYNPNQIAEDIKKNQGFIPGVKPGKKTAEFIDTILTRVTLPGSIFLAFVAVLPAIVGSLGMSNNFAQFFGGTTLLIMIGVVLDTLQQIESYLLNRHYDGLMKTGRVRGRNPRTTSPA